MRQTEVVGEISFESVRVTVGGQKKVETGVDERAHLFGVENTTGIVHEVGPAIERSPGELLLMVLANQRSNLHTQDICSRHIVSLHTTLACARRRRHETRESRKAVWRRAKICRTRVSGARRRPRQPGTGDPADDRQHLKLQRVHPSKTSAASRILINSPNFDHSDAVVRLTRPRVEDTL